MPMMLTDHAVTVLAAMSYRVDAEWGVNILPFGSVYWTDEMPALKDLNKAQDVFLIYTMFGLRLKLWDNLALNAEELVLWDTVRQQVPNWALFKRLSLSDTQRQAREQAERQVEREFESLGDSE